MSGTAPISLTPEQMFASVQGMRPDMDPYPNLQPGREKRFRAFLLKFGQESPQELNDIMTTPSKYSPIGGPRIDIVPGEGYAILVHYMEGGLASAELIEKWKADKKAQAEESMAQWRKAQKKYKGRGGIPDGDQLLTSKESAMISDEARAAATAYGDDDFESLIDPSIPATESAESEVPAEPAAATP